MNFIMFLITFTAVILLGCVYISLRLVARTSLRGIWRVLAYSLCFLPMLYVPVRYFTRSMERAGEAPSEYLDMALLFGHVLIGSLSVIATIVIIADILLLMKWIFKKLYTLKTKNTPSEQKSNNIDTDRRLFLQNSLSASLVFVGGGLVTYGVSEAMGMPAVKNVSVPVHNLPKHFHGFTIAQLTDLHINRPIPIDRLEKIVEAINELNVDAVVITGDMSDSYPEQVRAEMEPLRKLKAKHGKYFVSGNHEYYTDITGWLKEIDRLELDNLHNEHRVIEREGNRLLMCGVPDIKAPYMSGHISSPVLAQKGSREDDIKILLAHQPQSIYKAQQVNYDLQISGHTHGGQIFPWTWVTDWVQPYIHGLYKVENTQLYVSRGTGYWGPPLRIGAPAEITIIRLVDIT